jgi:hypothetical protein
MPIHGFPGGVISSTAVTPSPTSASGVWTLDEQLQAGANWPVAPALLTNSVRLRSSASAYLSRTPASAGSKTTWTFSCWFKRGSLTNSPNQTLFSASGGSAEDMIRIIGTAGSPDQDKIGFYIYNGAYIAGNFTTTQVFRDPASWYHLVWIWDSTNATSTDRVRLYINGQRVTSFSESSYPALNAQCGAINNTYQHEIGRQTNATTRVFDGYLTDINFIDGQALTPNYFGAVDAATGVWEPATYRGTYGTNGFYLPMNKTVEDYSIDYLVVAGGGGGGNDNAGGGGAGGLLTGTTSLIQTTIYTVTVGSGGAGSTSATVVGTSGGNSVVSAITSTGGGGGGSDGSGARVGANGGSGGGGAGNGSSAGGTGTSGQGTNGGSGYISLPVSVGGGGGGAGAVGQNANTTANQGGNGGNGLQSSITGTSTYYAGGGGGGNQSGTSVAASGGQGGGGNGGCTPTNTAPTNATANSGGGGGGGLNSGRNGSNGGSGVVILRVPTVNYSGVTTGSPTVTTDGSFTVVKFTSSGSYTA